MTGLNGQEQVKAPSAYQEWIDCLNLLKKRDVKSAEVYEALTAGSFAGTDTTLAALQRQILETVNASLDISAKRFIGKMNECIAFNELEQMDLLFHRLKRDIKVALFFEKLSFLPDTYRSELADSVKKQMADFWDRTVKFLYEQSVEFSNSDLEDALFLIKRIKIFE